MCSGAEHEQGLVLGHTLYTMADLNFLVTLDDLGEYPPLR